MVADIRASPRYRSDLALVARCGDAGSAETPAARTSVGRRWRDLFHHGGSDQSCSTDTLSNSASIASRESGPFPAKRATLPLRYGCVLSSA
jgi:hypothetical protein